MALAGSIGGAKPGGCRVCTGSGSGSGPAVSLLGSLRYGGARCLQSVPSAVAVEHAEVNGGNDEEKILNSSMRDTAYHETLQATQRCLHQQTYCDLSPPAEKTPAGQTHGALVTDRVLG